MTLKTMMKKDVMTKAQSVWQAIPMRPAKGIEKQCCSDWRAKKIHYRLA
jgi:hypothetical protein